MRSAAAWVIAATPKNPYHRSPRGGSDSPFSPRRRCACQLHEDDAMQRGRARLDSSLHSGHGLGLRDAASDASNKGGCAGPAPTKKQEASKPV